MIADVLVPKNPMRRILLGCCASEATGQAAAPPRIVMNARRFTVRCLSRAFDRKDSTPQLWQETAALRDFDPACVGFGSMLSKKA
jgi:hypothetical protein